MEKITINHNAQPVKYWLEQLETVLDPGWFECIARHIEAAGIEIEHCRAKKKACYIRCARTSCFALWCQRYKEDFGEDMPLHVDGKDWKILV